MEYLRDYESPLGRITLAGDGEALAGLWFEGQKHFAAAPEPDRVEAALPVFDRAEQWLNIYFQGRDPGFTPPLALKGTPFQISVWNILRAIPFGETVTYGQIAAQIARDRGLSHFSAQAVGGAAGRNPVSLIVPCHRIIGADGSLTGYAGGLERKKYLLEMERKR